METLCFGFIKRTPSPEGIVSIKWLFNITIINLSVVKCFDLSKYRVLLGYCIHSSNRKKLHTPLTPCLSVSLYQYQDDDYSSSSF